MTPTQSDKQRAQELAESFYDAASDGHMSTDAALKMICIILLPLVRDSARYRFLRAGQPGFEVTVLECGEDEDQEVWYELTDSPLDDAIDRALDEGRCKLVPVEPTDEMIDAWFDTPRPDAPFYKMSGRAMIAAAPDIATLIAKEKE
jgi:hypothetical protein